MRSGGDGGERWGGGGVAVELLPLFWRGERSCGVRSSVQRVRSERSVCSFVSDSPWEMGLWCQRKGQTALGNELDA